MHACVSINQQLKSPDASLSLDTTVEAELSHLTLSERAIPRGGRSFNPCRPG